MSNKGYDPNATHVQATAVPVHHVQGAQPYNAGAPNNYAGAPNNYAGGGGVAQPMDLEQDHNMQRGRDFLARHHWPTGLMDSMMDTTKKVVRRYMIVDDSGSMAANDGNRLAETTNGPKVLKCSRWSELVSGITFHAEFADAAKAPTEIRLLNGAQPFVIGEREDDGQSLRVLNAILDGGPRGRTPLCKHIGEVAREIRRIAGELRHRNQIVSVTIFTDGEASDGTMSTAMRQLEGLPVWTVVRLCTDEDDVVNYWNDIDQNVELEMDVLDDLFGECDEVMSVNPWLTYGEPMHRFREFGTPRKELDALDEQKLAPDAMLSTLAMVLGGTSRDYPHPQADMAGLLNKVKGELQKQPPVFSPRSKRQAPWIDVKKLNSAYGDSKCTVM